MDPTSLLGGELDEDYFLPPSGSSLASIFGSQKTKSPNNTNDSLKYIPAKLPDVNKAKEGSLPDIVESPQQSTGQKTSECLMAKVVHAHELINGAYEAKGKLGFAILKMLSPPHISMVLFNAAKITLSTVVVSEHLEVTIQSNNYITYYDCSTKNWSLLFSNYQDLSEVVEELKKHNVNVKQPIATQSTNTSATQSSEAKSVHEKEVESSNDSRKSKQAKLSLLNRMAMVGQAILPQRPISDRISDSSDEDTQPKEKPPPPSRYKGIKPTSTVTKVGNNKNLAESSDSSSQDVENVNISTIVPIASHSNVVQPTPLFTYVNGHIVPVTTNDAATGSGLNVFLSETRASNSEVRININRIGDKVDQILDKLKSGENSKAKPSEAVDGSSTFAMEIFQKLLREYEDKINAKDCLIRSLEEQLRDAQNTNTSVACAVTKVQECSNCAKFDKELKVAYENMSSENAAYKIELQDIRNSLAIKHDEIESLRKQVVNDSETLNENAATISRLNDEKGSLAEKITSMQLKLDAKESEIEQLNLVQADVRQHFEKMELENSRLAEELTHQKQKQADTSSQHLEIETRIKKIMNNTFRALAASFENDTSYSGSDIRGIIASVIKQTTLESLSPGPAQM